MPTVPPASGIEVAILDRVGELDSVMRDLRGMIYASKPEALTEAATSSATPLHAQVLKVLDEAAPHLGFTPILHWSDSLDSGSAPTLSLDLVRHVLAVLREALTNVARHAGARHTAVSLSGGTILRLTISDDGCGLPEHRRAGMPLGGHGLLNLAHRAEIYGGTFAIGANPGGGTLLTWSVPLVLGPADQLPAE